MLHKPAPFEEAGAQKRLPPAARRNGIIQKATEYFAENGFAGGTRELARHIGITQPLLYRYFPSKDALIREVYSALHARSFPAGWDEMLVDRSKPVRTRLFDFYDNYTNVVFNRVWLRLLVLSRLDALAPNRLHAQTIRTNILSRVVAECRLEAGLQPTRPTMHEFEIAWALHTGIISYGIQRFVCEWPTLEDKQQMIWKAIDAYLAEVCDISFYKKVL